MALNLRERFGARKSEPRPSLAEDFAFVPAEYPSLREYRVEHEEVSLLEAPLAVDRYYFLSRGTESLKIELALCLAGAEAADELLFQRAAAFEREPQPEAMVDLARSQTVGEVGLAWSWGGDERDGVAAFVRHNVLVFLQGRHEGLLEYARALDAALVRRKTVATYREDGEALFGVGGKDATLRAAPGTRVDLGPPTKPDAQHFFVATGGSVNRDPSDPARYYYRAGLEKGTHRLTAFRLGRGLLPVQQTLRITIA
jgi:hypothetical protein